MIQIVSPAFRFNARLAEDIEKYRKAARNQLRILTLPTDVPDEDGVCRGMGAPLDSPAVAPLVAFLARLDESEKEVKRSLEKSFKKDSPLAQVVADTHGLGVPMVVKLLGVIGDPYIKPAQVDLETGELLEAERPRTLSELFAYCGVAPHTRKKKGVKCTYNPLAQSTLWNMAEAVQKIPAGKSELKDTWTKWKTYYSTREDDKGKQWTWTHVKLAAHRKVAREILKTLYFEAKKVHENN